MRREDEETLDAIRDALDEDGLAARREVAALHRVETWRERLLAEGDAALAELLEEHPGADRQHLRQLARNAHEEKLRNKGRRARSGNCSRNCARCWPTTAVGDTDDEAGLDETGDETGFDPRHA